MMSSGDHPAELPVNGVDKIGAGPYRHMEFAFDLSTPNRDGQRVQLPWIAATITATNVVVDVVVVVVVAP